VSPGYFDTLGIPILRGRDFTLRDTAASPRVAIVNEAFVRQFAGNADPLGQTLRTGAEPRYPSTVYEIVGVIPDTQYNDLRSAPPPMAFAPDSQNPALGTWVVVMVHSSLEPAAVMASMRRHLAAAHPEVIAEFIDFRSEIRAGFVRERLLAMLAGFFGGLAALLAMVGLYGMISFAVAERRKEIGIRIALGARRPQVIAMMMREAGFLLAAGVVIGAVLSLVSGRAAAALLFGLTPSDPLALLAACTLLTIVAIVASFVPARNAARLNPVTALRHD
jgi:hypothetical protein